MIKRRIFILAIFLLLIAGVIYLLAQKEKEDVDKFISYIADIKKQELKFYFKNERKENFKSIQRLKNWLDSNNRKLVFAMNGGMYKQDNSPQGLYIEDAKTITTLDITNSTGNFYLKPNGVFYITTDNYAQIIKTEDFVENGKIKYATQSGPMLVINGQIHPSFIKGSMNLNIRNGVGILSDGRIVFAMSKREINFYDFAEFFKKKGCKNALYLDGLVSRTYLPENNWVQIDGNFGVIIGVTTAK